MRVPLLSLCCFVTTVGFTVFKASIVVCACSKATTVKQVRPVKFHRPFKLPTDQTTKLNKRALCYQRFHPACPKEIFILKQLKTSGSEQLELNWTVLTTPTTTIMAIITNSHSKSADSHSGTSEQTQSSQLIVCCVCVCVGNFVLKIQIQKAKRLRLRRRRAVDAIVYGNICVGSTANDVTMMRNSGEKL